MSIVRESCRCGACIEFDDRSLLPTTSDQRLTEFRREHICGAPETAGAGEAPTRAGFSEAMNQALRDMTVERDEARAELAEVTRRSRETLHINDELSAEVERLCDDMAHQVRRHGEAIARAEKAESERDEARASVLAARKDIEAARTEVEKARAEIKATNGALARGRASAAAVARVLNLCNEKPECDHGLDCHCDCLAPKDVRAAVDATRPIDGEE